MSSVFLIFPNQLYESAIPTLRKYDKVILVEEPIYFYDPEYRPVRPNKIKIAFLRAAMRQYYGRLISRKVPAEYVEYAAALKGGPAAYVPRRAASVTCYDPTDHGLAEKLRAALQQPLTFLESPNFILTVAELGDLKPAARLTGFYAAVKKKLGILVGTKSQDAYNRLPPPTDADNSRKEETYTDPAIVAEALTYTEKIAGDHCGTGEALAIYPTTAAAAWRAFEAFLARRFKEFGPYEDAFLEENPFLYHSVLSPALNAGLLDPREVVARIMEEKRVPLNSREGIVRQIIGWREYMRYLYVARYDEMMAGAAASGRSLRTPAAASWRAGTTGIAPFDAEVKKALHYGYAHHIVRLMVFLSLFVMCGIDPRDVYSWFMEVVAIDAYDWVMVSNIWAMGYYYKGAMSRPYVSSSAYITRMSDYRRDGKWDVLWDALFYRYAATSDDATAYRRNLVRISTGDLKTHMKAAGEFIDSVARRGRGGSGGSGGSSSSKK